MACCKKIKNSSALLFLAALLLGILAGITRIDYALTISEVVAEIFMRIFKCLSIPVICTVLISTITNIDSTTAKRLTIRVVSYSVITTLLSALVALTLYTIIMKPQHHNEITTESINIGSSTTYSQHIINSFPSHIYAPFIEYNVVGALIIALAFGFGIKIFERSNGSSTIKNVINDIKDVFMIITRWLINILPIGVFAFTTLAVVKFNVSDVNDGIARYIGVVVGANLVQGFLILPALLIFHRISPLTTLKNSTLALSTAFFSKSSSGTLPITMQVAEDKLGISNAVSKFILPLCTSINMNGCAAFIFTTTIFIMESNGIHISFSEMMLWAMIATVAAIGNAGIPMGCFFLSFSLLSSMNLDISLLSVILPLYTIFDMIETALNVWSDICITKIIDTKDRIISA
ncbi:Putative dicarboxylate/amino acid:cation symporter [Candidatus Fokinia solitaria]|uniref:Dicarboxylate/amino acid:cation symporter n=1 Tax=Candidatus Fokinia solitaria TaxID=1802984 RepID=A0A2U8BSN4_9RICK|nr:cation:dicarboxylase symporter family transporter [Candidatus Fokinia solitaria]AWD33351.1 Putative dicarboxylate/amino acid:cation symporter [Candidatus Fokinia solitaria]